MSPILVIGASGKTGRRIVTRLKAAKYAVRPVGRRTAIPFDWEKPESWAPALEGAAAAYISYFPDIAFPGAVERVAALAERAKAQGVGRLVLLSGRGEHHARRGEEAIRGSGVPFTLVRAAWFAQNFSEGYLRDPVLNGAIAVPAGDMPEPIIDVEDIADVAVAALTQDGHAGELYEVTGPRLMSFGEMAQTLSAAIGRPIRYRPISFEDFHAGLLPIGGPLIADVFTAIARETLDGRNASVADGVQRALGRPARDFADFARAAAAAGAFSAAA